MAKDLQEARDRVVGTAALSAATSLSSNYGGNVSQYLKQRMRGEKPGESSTATGGRKKQQPDYGSEDGSSDDEQEAGREVRPEFMEFIAHASTSGRIVPVWQQEVRLAPDTNRLPPASR